MAKEKVIAAIDIGSSKITTLIAQQPRESGNLTVIGVSTVPARGIRKGQVVDIDESVSSLSASLEAAERMAGFQASSAYITVGGSQIASMNSRGVVAVSGHEGEITDEDIRRVTEAARAISIPSSREILHVVPRGFIVDSQEGVKDPIGMSGVRLEVETHIVSGAATSIRNLTKIVNQIGVEVEDLVFSGLASAESTLTDTEKELGVASRHVGIGHTLRRCVAEVAKAVDHLLGRAAADAELQAAAGDEIGGACVLRHVQRVLVAHVDDRRADLDPLRPRAAGRQ